MTVAEKLIRAKEDIDEVFEAGKQAEIKRRWDVIQPDGTTRTDYRYMFAGCSWTDDIFKPKKKIRPQYAEYMFSYSHITDLTVVDIDLSRVQQNNVNRIFAFARITDVGDIDTTSITSMTYMFTQAQRLVNCGTVTLKSDGTQTFGTTCFQNCNALVEIRFEGVIGRNLDIRWSTLLSAGSLESIVTHLSDDVTGQTITLPTTAEANYNAVYGEGAWAALVATKPNWTFAYA